MNQKVNGYVVTNGNGTTTGYVSENDCCITNSFSSINYHSSNNGFSKSYVSYKSTKYTDDVFQR
jgi:hypothetical protein